MKERVLSLLLACFMVVTSVIIALPHKHAHAAEANDNRWVFADKGNTNYYNVNFYSDYPSKTLRDKTFSESGWVYTSGDAFVKYKGTNDFGGVSVYIRPTYVRPNDDGSSRDYNIAIEFTAPTNGFYSYEEIVSQSKVVSNIAGRKWNYNLVFSVIKGDVIYDTYTVPNEVPATGTLSGVVPMKQGEVLKFVAHGFHGNNDVWDTDQGTGNKTMSIESIVVEKVGELPENAAEKVYKPAFNGTSDGSTTSGSMSSNGFSLEMIDGEVDTWEVFGDWTRLSGSVGSDGSWIAAYSNVQMFKGTATTLEIPSTSPIRSSDDNVLGSAIRFVVPETGEYALSQYLTQNVIDKGNNNLVTYAITVFKAGSSSNRFTVDSIKNSANSSYNSSANNMDLISTPLGGTSYLEKGDVVVFSYFNHGSSTYRGAKIHSLQIVQIPHYCHGGTADCLNKAVCVDCGKEYGTVSTTNHVDGCTAEYTFDATTHTSIWSTCRLSEDSVDHDWDENGVCEDCEYACKHSSNDVEATCTDLAVCATCGASHGELDPDAHYGDPSFNYKKATKTHHYISYSCCGCDFFAEKHSLDDNDNCTVCDYGMVFNVPVVEEPDGRPSADPNCKHTGGVATCRAKAVCTKCGGVYGSLDPNNHASEALNTVVNSKTHSSTHACCGAVAVEETEHTYDEKGKCTGCTYKCSHNSYTEGVCDKCGYKDPSYTTESDDPDVSETTEITTDDSTPKKDNNDNKNVVDVITIAAIASVVLAAVAVCCAVIALTKKPKKK